jgi:hypothetical protein
MSNFVQNYTCYHDTLPETVAQCFEGGQGQGVYIPAVNKSGAACSYDDSYFTNMAAAQKQSGITPIAMVDADGSLESFGPLAECYQRGEKLGVKWGGAFIDYEHGSCGQDLSPLRQAVGSKPIYVYHDPGASTCYETWVSEDPTGMIPVTNCYLEDGAASKACTSASYNTPHGGHFIYEHPPTKFSGKFYDKYNP